MSKKKLTQTTDNKPAFIVGIGASAGGVEALTSFFSQVTADSGLAYVVILHLSPDYDSQLAAILQEVTPIPVTQVTKATRVEANRVYVVPPDKQLEMQDGTITVRATARLEERRAPVDMFLRTLAESHGPQAVAVILSGTGANGSMGLKRIKEKGGAVFVQKPREAAFNEMPRHAIATDLVDDILPVAQIPAQILTYVRGLDSVSIAEEATQRPDDQYQALREIFTQLRVRTGHDFANYKRSTLLRRLERRISVRDLPDLPAYAAFLREQPDETQALLKDLLISVTNFFRDEQAFQYLENQVLPLLLRSAQESVRIWVAGCATGEEAYSLAILCAEQTLGVIDAPKVQIFATDIDEDAIATAREGLYTLNDAADVSADRLSRFFIKEGDDYRVRREIREMILFANQNVLKDPPFSKLNLVTCRNLLIYLNPVAQERIMETFHFALNPGNYMMLGLSETVDGSGNLYATVSRDHHIYQSRQVATRPYPVPESIPQVPPARKPSFEPASDRESRAMTRLSFGDLHQQLLEQYAPPSLIVNGDYDILHFTPHAGRYLHFAGGELSKNLLKLIRDELRLELRTALYQATQRQTSVDVHNLTISLDGQIETLTLHVRPVLGEADPARGFILVLFEPTTTDAAESVPVLTQTEPMARQLEDELIRVKAQLRSANEQHELQAEELKASNEELQAMNEELRSAAEELETSKEELQSINEELTTVNQELKVKVEESSLVSNNLQNLINSTDIATLFLDRGFRVNLFTPTTRQIFNLIPSDNGRLLSDITNRLVDTHLQTEAETVLKTLQPIEREVSTTDSRVFIMRVMPYRTAEDRINGVVLTFVDITERKRAEEALRRSEEKYRSLFTSIDEAFALCQIIVDKAGEPIDYRLLEVNPAFETMTGISSQMAQGKTARELVPGLEDWWIQTYGRVALQRETYRFENRVEDMNRWFDAYAAPADQLGSGLFTLVFKDVSERKRTEEQQAFLLKLSDALRSLSDPHAIQETTTQITMEYLGTDRCYYCEIKEGDVYIYRDARQPGLISVQGTYLLNETPIFNLALKNGQPFIAPNVYNTELLDESLRQTCIQLQIISFINIPVIKEGQPVGILCLTQVTPRDWTNFEVELGREVAERIWTAVERARVEAALRETEKRLAGVRPLTLLGQTEDLAQLGSWEYQRSRGQFTWSDGMYRLFGLEKGEVIQPTVYVKQAVADDRAKAQQLVTYLYEGIGKLEMDLRIWVGDRIKTLRIKAEVNDENGLRVLGVNLDLTEQLITQRQIRETAESLQAVLDASPASIGLLKAVHDPVDPKQIVDFNLAVGNNKLAEFFNLPLNQLLGKSAVGFASLLWDGETLAILRQIYVQHEYHYEERQLPATDKNRWLAISVMRQDDGVVFTGLDITQLKEIQSQRQDWLSELESSRHSVDALAELRASLNQRTELMRAVSHDLRGNFGIINSALQLLGMASDESERAQMIEMVLRNVRQATGLLTDLLDLVRLETGQQQSVVDSFDAALLLTELVQSLQPMADDQSLALLQSGPDTLVVENDRQLVYRMAQNLIINALKYTHQGQVIVQWGEEGEQWWFDVVDTGPGLPPDLAASLNATLSDQPEPTDPEAERSASESANETRDRWSQSERNWLQGEGIGLRIVRELATLLNAKLQVSSETGVGTRFRISYPRRYATLPSDS